MGKPPQSQTSPEGANQESAESLLKILLAKREAGFRGRGKYHLPAAPDLEGLPEPPVGWIWASPEQLANAAPYSLSIGPFGSNLKVSDYQEAGVPLIFVRNIRAEDFSLTVKFVAEQKAHELAAHTAEGGDILITKMGEPPGDAAFYPIGAPKAVITADCIKWRLADDLRVPKFFVYAIRSRLVQQQIQNRTRGVAQKKISLERFRDLAIPLPPLPEQRRIVAEIEKQFTRLEAGVAALRRVQANLKRYRAAVLKAACEGKLVPTEAELVGRVPPRGSGHADTKVSAASGNTAYKTPDYETGEALLQRILNERRKNWPGRGKYKEPTAPDTANLPPLPEGWTWSSVAQTGEATTGFTPPKGNADFFGGNIPFFKPTDLDAGFYVCEFRDSLTESGAEHGRLLPERSILVTCIGATIGKAGFARVRCATNQQINALTVPLDLVSAEYVFWYFNSPFAQEQINENASATTLPILNKSKFEALPIPLPPLAEQIRIVAEVERRLSVVEGLESVVSANLQRATRLRQSILQKAFTGELC
jgi:type I restriction enzyme S subunit